MKRRTFLGTFPIAAKLLGGDLRGAVEGIARLDGENASEELAALDRAMDVDYLVNAQLKHKITGIGEPAITKDSGILTFEDAEKLLVDHPMLKYCKRPLTEDSMKALEEYFAQSKEATLALYRKTIEVLKRMPQDSAQKDGSLGRSITMAERLRTMENSVRDVSRSSYWPDFFAAVRKGTTEALDSFVQKHHGGQSKEADALRRKMHRPTQEDEPKQAQEAARRRLSRWLDDMDVSYVEGAPENEKSNALAIRGRAEALKEVEQLLTVAFPENFLSEERYAERTNDQLIVVNPTRAVSQFLGKYAIEQLGAARH